MKVSLQLLGILLISGAIAFTVSTTLGRVLFLSSQNEVRSTGIVTFVLSAIVLSLLGWAWRRK